MYSATPKNNNKLLQFIIIRVHSKYIGMCFGNVKYLVKRVINFVAGGFYLLLIYQKKELILSKI
jgi:hypothetical protein